jgi:hypothetical protein
MREFAMRKANEGRKTREKGAKKCIIMHVGARFFRKVHYNAVFDRELRNGEIGDFAG